MKRALLLVCLLAGCSQFDTGSVAMRSLAASLDCPEARVDMTQEGAYRYRGEGCGRESVVVCTASRLEPQCLATATAGGERAPEDLADARPDSGGDGDRGGEEAGADDGETVLAETADADIESQIRAGLDARSEDVLACTGRDRVAVRAGYAPDGSVAFSLQGPLRGTPEEGCVQDVLDGVRVPATGEAAVVIHLVRHVRRPAPDPPVEPAAAPEPGTTEAASEPEPAPETEAASEPETEAEPGADSD